MEYVNDIPSLSYASHILYFLYIRIRMKINYVYQVYINTQFYDQRENKVV